MIPQKLLHRGTVTAAAFLFDPALLREDEAQKRILALWEPGVRVWQTEDGALLMVLTKPQTLAAKAAPGLPLVRERGHLLALPLTKAEWDELRPAPESLIYAQRGHITALSLAELTAIEPADWLALESIAFVPTKPLIEPVPTVEAPIGEVLAPLKTLQIVPTNPATAAARAALLHSLNQAPTTTQKTTSTPSSFSLLERWGRVLLDFLRPTTPSSESASTTDKLRNTIREQVFSPGQLEAISRQNAEFLQKMLELFEKGQWQEALQHAIPLGKPGESDDTPAGFAFLKPRDQLVISPTPTQASSALPWDGLHGGFKQLYREAVERLKNEGRFEEAAYVLAELLREDEEAVSFLERHGKLRLAAEMAEARNLLPALIVRQWWLAGEKERAIAIARRSQCFSDAIFRLERSQHTAAAETLRVEWAQLHAEWGDYAKAVTTIQSVETARPLAKRWAERGADLGGVGGAQLLARLLIWSKNENESAPWREKASAVVADPRAVSERTYLLGPLFLEGKDRPELLPLFRAGLRAVLADQGSGATNLLKPDVATRWARVAKLPALEADLPALTPKPQPALFDRTEPLEIRIEGGDTGTVPIVDAAYLPDGRTLAALGEAGVLLLSHDGRILHRFELPATSLVIGKTGARAIALAHRDDSQRVHVLDLGTRKTTDWGELSLLCWETALSEGTWRVARQGQLLTLDTLSPTPKALTITETKEPTLALSPGSGVLSLDDGRFVLWTEATPTRRQEIPFSGGTFELTDQSVYWLQTDDDEELSLFGEPAVVLYGQTGPLHRSCVIGEPGDTPAGLAATRLGVNELTLSALRDPLGITALVCFSTAKGLRGPVLQLRLSGAERVRLRATPKALTLADSQGRILVIHPVTGQLVRDLRVRL
jgi:hypothetical protein